MTTGIWAVVVGIAFAAVAAAAYAVRQLRSELGTTREALRAAEEQAQSLATITATARAMVAAETHQIVDAVADGLVALGFDLVAIFVNGPDDGLRYAASHGLPPEVVRGARHHRKGLAGEILRTGATVVVEDYAGYHAASESYRLAGLRTAIGTPVRQSGRIVGVVTAGTLGPRAYGRAEREAFELLAGLAGTALENALRSESQRRDADHFRKRDRQKTEFLSRVSHELRTPLTVILGLTETLAVHRERLDAATQSQLIDRIQANTVSLDRIIGSLLDFSRLERGRLEVSQEPFDLGELVERVVERLDSVLAAHDGRVSAAHDATVMGDERLIERVVENLLTNAARHTPAGTRVDVSVKIGGGEATVAVADDGPGIRSEDLARLGEQFFRGGEPGERAEGTGVGLALVKEVLGLHGTRLQIDSNPGEGARFAFSLPLVLEVAFEPGGFRRGG